MENTQLLNDIKILIQDPDFRSDEWDRQYVLKQKYRLQFQDEELKALLSKSKMHIESDSFKDFSDWMLKIDNYGFKQIKKDSPEYLNLKKRHENN